MEDCGGLRVKGVRRATCHQGVSHSASSLVGGPPSSSILCWLLLLLLLLRTPPVPPVLSRSNATARSNPATSTPASLVATGVGVWPALASAPREPSPPPSLPPPSLPVLGFRRLPPPYLKFGKIRPFENGYSRGTRALWNDSQSMRGCGAGSTMVCIIPE
jgi:hypothetical protein